MGKASLCNMIIMIHYICVGFRSLESTFSSIINVIITINNSYHLLCAFQRASTIQ